MFGIDLISLITAAGYLGIFGIIFAESGLLIGFFLPGDSLLFTAGFLASQGFLSFPWLIFITFGGAVLGDSFGYMFGRKVGPKIFKKENSLIFHQGNLEKAEKFYAKHGGKTLILARFMPIIRTFAPILAGVSRMPYPTFLFYNILGAVFWAIGVTWTGYYLGNKIPNVEHYLLPIILGVIVLSILPTLIPILKSKKNRKAFWEALKSILKRKSK